jgi:heme-degrading monooxygenase HmoA
MILVAFRGRVRHEHIDEIIKMDKEMRQLVQSIPGFVEYKEFSAPDGENVTIAVFQDDESLRAWREHPRHREAMRLGYDRWLSSYDISVCEVKRRYTREDRQRGIAQGKAPGVILD